MRTISTSSVSQDEVLASLSAQRNATQPKLFLGNVLLTSCMQFLDVHLSVHRSSSFRRTLPSGSSTAAVRQSVHRPVNDGKVFKQKWNGLGLSLIMTKFGTLCRCLCIPLFTNEFFHLRREMNLRVPKKDIFTQCWRGRRRNKRTGWKSMKYVDFQIFL